MQAPKKTIRNSLMVVGFLLLMALPFTAFRQSTPVAPPSKDGPLNPYSLPKDEAAQLIQKASENYFYREFKQGADNYRKAIAIYESRSDLANIAKTYRNLADLYVWAREPDEAISNYSLAANYHLQEGNAMEQAEDLMEIGEVHSKQERFDEAERWYQKSLMAVQGTKMNRVFGQIQEARGHNHWANEKIPEAISAFTQAKKVYAHLHYNMGEEHLTHVINRLKTNKTRLHRHAVREGGFQNEYKTH